MSLQLSGIPLCWGYPACSGRYNNDVTSGLVWYVSQYALWVEPSSQQSCVTLFPCVLNLSLELRHWCTTCELGHRMCGFQNFPGLGFVLKSGVLTTTSRLPVQPICTSTVCRNQPKARVCPRAMVAASPNPRSLTLFQQLFMVTPQSYSSPCKAIITAGILAARQEPALTWRVHHKLATVPRTSSQAWRMLSVADVSIMIAQHSHGTMWLVLSEAAFVRCTSWVAWSTLAVSSVSLMAAAHHRLLISRVLPEHASAQPTSKMAWWTYSASRVSNKAAKREHLTTSIDCWMHGFVAHIRRLVW